MQLFYTAADDPPPSNMLHQIILLPLVVAVAIVDFYPLYAPLYSFSPLPDLPCTHNGHASKLHRMIHYTMQLYMPDCSVHYVVEWPRHHEPPVISLHSILLIGSSSTCSGGEHSTERHLCVGLSGQIFSRLVLEHDPRQTIQYRTLHSATSQSTL